MKPLTALPVLSIAVALVVPIAASAQYPSAPRSAVSAPASRIVATDQPVPVDLMLTWPTANLGDYSYSARVAVAADPAPRDVVDSFPLTGDPANPAHWTGTASDGLNDGRWASRPGTYFIGVEAHFTHTDATCTTDQRTGTVTCAVGAFPVLAERPLHEVVVVARLNLSRAKVAARRHAAKIGWRSQAPLTCHAAGAAFACTFVWHAGTHPRRTVRRLVLVAQTARGTITVRHAVA